jgi:hypothetical protein
MGEHNPTERRLQVPAVRRGLARGVPPRAADYEADEATEPRTLPPDSVASSRFATQTFPSWFTVVREGLRASRPMGVRFVYRPLRLWRAASVEGASDG